jgi:hypothetical protein
MRAHFKRFAIGLAALAPLFGGCDSSQKAASLAPQLDEFAPIDPAVFKQLEFGHAERDWAYHDVVLEFQVIDVSSRTPIERASVEIVNAFQFDPEPIRASSNDAGLARLAYQGRYLPENGLPPESDFLGDMWLTVSAPQYETMRVALRNFVRTQRTIDIVPWVKSADFIVALRKGTNKYQPIGFIAGRYSERGSDLVLEVFGNGTFSLCQKHQHGCTPAGFGFAEVINDTLKLTFAEPSNPLEGSPELQAVLRRVNALIQEQPPARARE